MCRYGLYYRHNAQQFFVVVVVVVCLRCVQRLCVFFAAESLVVPKREKRGRERERTLCEILSWGAAQKRSEGSQ